MRDRGADAIDPPIYGRNSVNTNMYISPQLHLRRLVIPPRRNEGGAVNLWRLVNGYALCVYAALTPSV